MAITTQVVGALPVRKMFIGTQVAYSATVKLTSFQRRTATYWDPSSAVDPAKLITGYSGITFEQYRGQVAFAVEMSPSNKVYLNASNRTPVSAGERIPAGTPVGINYFTTITFTIA